MELFKRRPFCLFCFFFLFGFFFATKLMQKEFSLIATALLIAAVAVIVWMICVKRKRIPLLTALLCIITVLSAFLHSFL